MVTKLSRKIFNDAIGNPALRRAIALSIFLKDHNKTSVYKHYSVRELSRISNLSPNTCKERINTLVKNNLAFIKVENGIKYLKLNKLRRGLIHFTATRPNGEKVERTYYPRKADVSLEKINRQSVKEIELGLMSLSIVEITIRKEFVKHQIDLAHNPMPYDSLKAVKRAMRKCRLSGYGDKFVDDGLSYRTLQRRLSCGASRVKKVIDYGEKYNLFSIVRRSWEKICANVHSGDYLGDFSLFATSRYVWHKPALLFILR